MGLNGNYLVSLLLCIFVVNEVRLPLVTCQNEDSAQCMPKSAFLALLHHPEVSSNLDAYYSLIMRNYDKSHLRALIEGSDDHELCIPSHVYLQLLKDPVVRSDLSAILNGRSQKLPEIVGRLLDDSDEMDEREPQPEAQKRSIAILAKNDDLPISIYDRMVDIENDEEKRAVLSSEQRGQNDEVSRDYFLPSGRSELQGLRDFSLEKRNVGTLARDFALPPGRRNIASLLRDYDPSKGNRDRVTLSGKRNVASLARTYALPQSGKRNVASVARSSGLPYGKRYVGALARSGEFPIRDQRSVSSLARNSAWPVTLKRGVLLPGSVILKALSRHGRSLSDEINARNDLLDLQELSNLEQGDDYEDEKLSDTLANFESNVRRPKRQIGFSDEYPLPVMQNTNAYDYEEMMDTVLNGQYPNTEKRFMETGSAPEMQPEVGQFGYPETFQASKRHIGALARLGWLSSFRASRFSRSPRYLVGREDSVHGTSSDYTSDSTTRSLRPNFNPRVRYVRAMHGDCRHGFKGFPRLSTTDNYFHQKLPSSLRSKSL
ncbi:PREDICTED: neuropeptide-like 1 isoform X2 [Eufriesea mexicana]|uniref:neuropeptide-like 1 isoform X2 n=1 Tax=Eufriesea mexicana TaxID=516756 RepID=UPI00083C0ACF|nr:PREDICTED: neuropeptide-like 1 isoform X2 [Eufriesea mexicana]